MKAIGLLMAAGLAVGAASMASAAEIKGDATNTMNTVAGLFKPFWTSDITDRETVFFFQRKEGEQAWASLLFAPDKILSVRSASGATTYEDGKDFAIDKENGVLRLVPGSRIPFKTPGEMYPPAGSNLPKYGHKRGDSATCLIFGEGHFFHDLQVDVTYTHAPNMWKGPVPVFQGTNMPGVLGKLKRKQPITVCAAGDSITAGYNATKSTGAPPFQPCYPELVALGLEKAYGVPVTFKNFAVGVWTSDQGLAAIDRVANEKPDLVIVAFGMNDTGKPAAKFAANIRAIMEKIRIAVPDADFVLVAPMLANAEWHAPSMASFPLFRDALSGLCGKGVVLADVTSVWTELLKRKTFHDLTGNGVNHPNDFGHRVYAQVILTLLVPGDLAAGVRERPVGQ